MTPLLWPVWCRATADSASSTTTRTPQSRAKIIAVASPTMPPPTMTMSACCMESVPKKGVIVPLPAGNGNSGLPRPEARLSCRAMPALDEIPYVVRLSGRARRIRVQVGRDGVVLVVPHRMPLARAEAFLRSQREWIRTHLDRRRRRAMALPPGTLLYRGRPVPVRVIEAPISRAQVRRAEGGFEVYAPPAGANAAEAALERTLRREAASVLAAEVAAESERTGLQPRDLSIRDQRTRWGSCAHSGHISLSWRLLLAPPEVLSYVVIHELAHLAQPNHGPGFWRLVAQYCPDFARHRAWLRRHGELLHRGLTQPAS
jgi:predicted metal-dependent hydrolase